MKTEISLISALNRAATGSDGYIRYQISRAQLQSLYDMVRLNPLKAEKLLKFALDQRPKDGRRKA